MFSGLEVADVQHGRRWTALASFVLQGIIITAAVILPLLNPTSLPDAFKHRISLPIALGDTHIKQNQDTTQQHGGITHLLPIVVHNSFTFHSGQGHETGAQDPTGTWTITGIGSGTPGIDNIFSGSYQPPVLHPAEKPKPISVMMEGNLIHRVEPQYPAIARQIRLEGTVVLQAFVSTDGRIERPKVLSGSAVLAQAALEAVRQWQYRPYYLNGNTIEVETEITVKFVLNQ